MATNTTTDDDRNEKIAKLQFLMGLTNLQTNQQSKPKSKSKSKTKPERDRFDSILEMLETSKLQIPQVEQEAYPSKTIDDQLEVEQNVIGIYEDYLEKGSNNLPEIETLKHIQYVTFFLQNPLTSVFVDMTRLQKKKKMSSLIRFSVSGWMKQIQQVASQEQKVNINFLILLQLMLLYFP
ncbi:unnamed protein product [Ambrosiozyma monospora]|uniref:Unnamed protein product n=1 Tax=Ambrosiozyma monospora TaxID=43982 RepID=A0ACB5TH00_AMBMO|nr:unnamed protein product [Ambrosiozyma monospora]